jgi:hypothetical protein
MAIRMIAVHRRDLAPRAPLGGAAVKMDKYLPSSEAFSKALARYQTTSPRYAAILKSWREHPDKDHLWRALQSAAIKRGKSPPDPADFIGVVLSSTMPAKRLNDHSARVLSQFEKLKQEICAIVKDAMYPLDLWRDLATFESSLRELERGAYGMYEPAGGRKDQNRSRDRKLFALRMVRYLEDSCGQRLVNEVAKMLDIVFPGVNHDERTVRHWLPKTPKPVV